MGRRGPAPKPTALRLLEGKADHRPLNDLEPRPDPKVPDCPKCLDRVARRKWGEIAPQLGAMGVLTRIDADALTNYCRAWSRWLELEEFLAENGHVRVVTGDDGGIREMIPYPQVAMAAKLLPILNRLQREFGMTPSARSQIHVIPADNGAASISKFLKIDA